MSEAKEKSLIKLAISNIHCFVYVRERQGGGGEEKADKDLGPKPISDERGLGEDDEAAKETEKEQPVGLEESQETVVSWESREEKFIKGEKMINCC